MRALGKGHAVLADEYVAQGESGTVRPDVARVHDDQRPTLSEHAVYVGVRRVPNRSARCGLQVVGNMPTEVAGAEQLLAVMRPDHDVVDEDGNVTVVGLESTGYATWIAEPVNRPLLHTGELLRLDVDYDATMVPGALSARLSLERAADAYLAHATGDAMRLDVLREVTKPNGVDSTWQSIVKADSVAWRGRAHYAQRSVRYGSVFAFVVAGDGTCEDHRGVTHVLGRKNVTKGYRMVGFKRSEHVSTRATKRTAGKVKQAQRRAAGVPVIAPVWTANERTIRRTWSSVDYGKVTTAEAIASALRMVRPGDTADVLDGVSVTVHASTVTDQAGRTFTIRDFARRAAMAGAGAI